jgi:anaerobic selenocysteine-containing dehydrogenase
MDVSRESIRTTCPRDCYDACGLIVMKENGEITRVRGDVEHPVNRGSLCGKCAIAYNGILRDIGVRLQTPLQRVGPKGKGHFAPISWDDAIATIAQRLKAIVANHGPRTILNAHYTGTFSRLAFAFPMRFFNRLGATEVEPDSICNLAGQMGLHYTIGSGLIGFDPRMVKDAACLVVWGANPSVSAPHIHQHWYAAAPGKKIAIDPVRHKTAQMADLHLQLFPGSDAALAFALLHVLRRDGLLDRDFIAKHVIGWQDISAVLDHCTPSWGEAMTDVPASMIERAAHLYGEGPALLWLGQGMQRQRHGGNAFRACAMLPAVTGNFGKPGTGLYYLNLDGAMRGFDDGYLVASHLRQDNRHTVSHMDLAAVLENPLASQALFCWNINLAASNPEQTRLHQALSREDLFTVVCELFQTDTADFADIVLPAASFLEFDDLVLSYFHLTVAAQVKVQQPLGESLPNQVIFRRLSRAMGYDEPELYESDRSIIDHLLRGMSLDGGFDALKQVGTAFVTPEPVPQFADLTFPTPSGKIEIASAQAEADGHPRLPQPIADPHPPGTRLRLLSPAGAWLMNDSYGNDQRIAKEMGPATVMLHPDDGIALGLQSGDQARLSNDTGELVLNVQLADEVRPGVALTYKGRWPKREKARANVNVLNPGSKTDMGDSTSVHGIEVAVTRLRLKPRQLKQW